MSVFFSLNNISLFKVTKKETVWESETDEEDEASVNKQEKKSHQSNTSEDMGKLATKNTKAKADPKGKAVCQFFIFS